MPRPVTQSGCGALCPDLRSRLLRVLRARGSRPTPAACRAPSWRAAARARTSAGCSPGSPAGRRRSGQVIGEFGGPPGMTPDRAMEGERRCHAADGTLVADAPGAEREFNVPYVTRVEGEGILVPARPRREVVEAPPEDLRGAALLRADRGGPDRRRGHRHRRPHLRDLPDRLPDDRRPRLRGPVRRRRCDPAIRSLRRLLYCGEYIQSHALHVYLLHAPDYLGYPSALAMAADHRAVVEQGLAIKKVGNQLIAALGGRPVHPISVRVGGFSRVPRRRDLDAVRRALDDAVDMVAGDRAPRRLVGSAGVRAPPAARGAAPSRTSIPSTTAGSSPRMGWTSRPGPGATPSRSSTSRGPTRCTRARTTARVYLLGPTARVALAADRLHPLAAEALEATGLRDAIRTNIHRSIVARAVELLHACAEARDIIDAYRLAARAARPVHPSGGDRRLVHGGSTGPPPSPVRDGRAGPRGRTPRSCPRPARTREPSRPTSRHSPRASSSSPKPRPSTASRC